MTNYPHKSPSLLLWSIHVLCACAALTALAGCGSSGASSRSDNAPVSFVEIGVADDGDLEGNIAAFEHRLAHLDKAHEKYPSTLERLALAYVEHADTLLADAEKSREAAERQALQAQAKEQQRRAIGHFESLVEGYPTYEGTPSAMLLLAYAYDAEGRAADRAAVLQRLVEGYPGTPLALDAVVLQADERFDAGDFDAALPLYGAAASAQRDAPRAAYAIHRQAWCLYRVGDPAEAFKAIKDVVTHPAAADAGLADAARRDMVLFYAASDAPSEVAAEVLAPFARDAAEQAAMMTLFEAARRKRDSER